MNPNSLAICESKLKEKLIMDNKFDILFYQEGKRKLIFEYCIEIAKKIYQNNSF